MSPNVNDPRTLATAAVIYTLVLLVVTRVVGVDTGLRSAEVFETHTELLGAVSPISIGRRRAGAAAPDEPPVAWRGWLRGLPHVPARRGLTWFVVAAIGTVAYDGMSSAAWWGDLFGAAARDQRFGTAALIGVVVLIGAGYYGASAVAARLADGGREVRAAALADGSAHALVSIALAYAFAHYCTFVAFDGRQLIRAASDPFGLGWDLFGTADRRIVSFLSPIAVWWIQLTAIVTGHVAATALIHDRALVRFGAGVALRAQYAMLVLMVALTSLGLVVSTG